MRSNIHPYLGNLPTDWNTPSLETVVKRDRPIVYGIVQAGPHIDGGVPYIKSTDVGGKLRLETLQRTSSEIHEHYRRAEVRPGDLVYSLRGEIGQSSIVPPNFPPANLTQGTARISTSREYDTEFVRYALQSPAIARRIYSIAKGSTFREVSLEQLRNLQIATPPLREQCKIAAILRTWDNAIDACLRKRVAKANALKAARQKVFGLDGVPPARWSSSKLNAIVDRIRRVADGGDHPVMTISGKSGFKRQDEKFDRFMAGDSVDRYLLLERGEFAYNKGNSKTYPQGCIYRLEQDKALVPFVYFGFALRNGHCSDFYAHLFEAGFLNHQLSRVINSGVRNDGLLNIYADDFFSCVVPVPTVSEQQRIAEFFNLAKQEMAALDRQILALRQQKRGLMQKLLTGEWRVGAAKEAAE